MDVQEYLMKARKADAVANAARSAENRRTWEDVAREYRRLANAIAEVQKSEGLKWPI